MLDEGSDVCSGAASGASRFKVQGSRFTVRGLGFTDVLFKGKQNPVEPPRSSTDACDANVRRNVHARHTMILEKKHKST